MLEPEKYGSQSSVELVEKKYEQRLFSCDLESRIYVRTDPLVDMTDENFRARLDWTSRRREACHCGARDSDGKPEFCDFFESVS